MFDSFLCLPPLRPPRSASPQARVSRRGTIGLVLLLSFSFLMGCGKRTSEGVDRAVTGSVYGDVIPVEVAVLQAEPFAEEFDVAGQVEAKELVTVSSEVAERVISVRPEIGDQVARGRRLLELDQRSTLARLSKTEAELARAKTDLAWAEKELVRQKQLFNDSVTAERALDDAQRTVDTARVEVQAQEAELELAKVALERTIIRAPMDGAVAKRYVSVGEVVAPGTPLMDLVSKRLLFVLSVAERDVVALAPGVELEIRLDALAQPVEGKVLAVSPSGNQQTRTFRVEVALSESSAASAGALPGMSGRTTVVRAQYDSALLLPEAAVLRDGNESYVYVLDRVRTSAVSEESESTEDIETVERRSVRIISQTGSWVVLDPEGFSDGFENGMEVVIVGQSAVGPGSKVRVRRRHETLIERQFE